MAFGLHNVAQTLQRFVYYTLQNLTCVSFQLVHHQPIFNALLFVSKTKEWREILWFSKSAQPFTIIKQQLVYGALLMKKVNRNWQLLSFFFKQMNPVQRILNY